MQKVKISIIGGGSRQWAIGLIKDLTLQNNFNALISLYDINNKAAEDNVTVANRIFKINKTTGFEVEAQPNLDKCLSGSDFTVISIEPGIIDCRYGDLQLPEDFGVLQSVGDTTGPGGIMRARRAIPLFVDFAKAMQKNCPETWVINYTNPMTLCLAALYRGFPDIKVVGCCHEVFHTQTFLAENCKNWFGATIKRQDINCEVSGINHFTFMPKATWQGHDLIEKTKELVNKPETFADRTQISEKWRNEGKWFDCEKLVSLSFLRDYGVLGAAGDRHLAEFVPFFLTSDENVLKWGFTRTPFSYRIEEDKRKHSKVYEDSELIASPSDEEGVLIMSALLGFKDMHTNINIINHGQVPYLPDGRIVECMADISKNCVKTTPSTRLPEEIEQMILRISNEQDMVLDAVLKQDNDKLFEAFYSDALMNLDREKAKELFDKMLIESRLRY